MRNKTKPQICSTSGKYIYSSEAKAQRALNRYDEIERIYRCEGGCGGWHTTSMTLQKAIEEGIIEKPVKRKKITSKMIAGKIKYLKKKIDARLT